MDNRANAQGLNAWWLYANIPRGTKVLVLPEGEVLLEAVPQPASIGEAGPLVFQVSSSLAEDDAVLSDASILLTLGGN